MINIIKEEFNNFCADKCPLNEKGKCQIIDLPCPVIGYVKYLSKLVNTKSQ